MYNIWRMGYALLRKDSFGIGDFLRIFCQAIAANPDTLLFYGKAIEIHSDEIIGKPFNYKKLKKSNYIHLPWFLLLIIAKWWIRWAVKIIFGFARLVKRYSSPTCMKIIRFVQNFWKVNSIITMLFRQQLIMMNWWIWNGCWKNEISGYVWRFQWIGSGKNFACKTLYLLWEKTLQ